MMSSLIIILNLITYYEKNILISPEMIISAKNGKMEWQKNYSGIFLQYNERFETGDFW